MSSRTRYAQVGLGVRSLMYSAAIGSTFAETAELVGLCDSNPGRLGLREKWAADIGAAPRGYPADDYAKMLAETRPDCVIVTSPDWLHDEHICTALEHDCDVITEKPLTIDAGRCARILEAQRRSGRQCRVAFNYRYAPARSQVKQLLQGGAIGEVLSVDFHWRLDTVHGADYFRRWHRNKRRSGGLLVHKATHHFDLVNWWLDSLPVRVQASGHRQYYAPDNALRLGLRDRGERCLGCAAASNCPFHLDLQGDPILKLFYLDHEAHDGYWRDRCVFSEEIDIEDCMNVLVDYACGAKLAYSLNASLPEEGYEIAFNGTRGRLEHRCVETPYVSGRSALPGLTVREATSIRLLPHFGEPRAVEVAHAEGAHGGGDAALLADLFAPDPPDDPFGRRADHVHGVRSVLTGIAANRAIETGGPIAIESLLSAAVTP